MPLQTQSLVMVAISVANDTPPNNIQPKLADGIHLRWAFKPELGFPWYGFYLFRRQAKIGDPICMSLRIRDLDPFAPLDSVLDVADFGTVSSDFRLRLANDFPPTPAPGDLELDLANRTELRFVPVGGEPARWVQARVGFRAKVDIHVTALLWGVPVAEATISGDVGQVGDATVTFDAITEVVISGGDASLVDLCYLPVAQSASGSWEKMSGFQYPMRLPVTNPAYPLTAGANENVAASRSLARQRIRYGDPNAFTAPLPGHAVGTVEVTNGSPVVLGTDTKWSTVFVGRVLQIAGDATAYTVLSVLGPGRLILGRNYIGVTNNHAGYALRDDAFGQLHDALTLLVDGGIAAGPMAGRATPVPVTVAGRASLANGLAVVTGTGTHWSGDLAGLEFQIGDAGGTVDARTGSSIVAGSLTTWGADLVGLAFRVTRETAAYSILRVDVAAQQLELDRAYGGQTAAGKSYTISESTVYTIRRVDSATQLTLDRAYLGMTGGDKHYSIFAALQPAGPITAPHLSRQYPLDMILVAAVHPAAAQMVGLYWIDPVEAVVVGPPPRYDYMIVADYGGAGGLTPEGVLSTLTQPNGFSQMEAYIVFDEKVAPAPPLAAPDGLQAYSLPGGSARDANGNAVDASNNAGLRWNLGRTDDGTLNPGKPLLFHVWRNELGNGENPLNSGGQSKLVTIRDGTPRAIRVARQLPNQNPQRPPDWPLLPMFFVDRGLGDGWYEYAVSGIDIFGRHSPNSAPVVAQFLDRIAPPPPTGVEATVLDPGDPTVVADAAYEAWRAANRATIGLRVRWLWTRNHIRQAPDTREFRIYYQSGRLNALVGRTAAVAPTSNAESWIDTDIPNTRPADAFAGVWLRIGNDTFRLVANGAASPLRVRVRSGATTNVGTVSVVNGSNIIEGANGADWGPEFTGATLTVAGEPAEYQILSVESRTRLIVNRGYVGATGGGRAYSIVGKLPTAGVACSLVIPPAYTAGRVLAANGSPIVTGVDTNWVADHDGWVVRFEGEQASYTVASIDSPSQLTLDNAYAGTTGGPKAYALLHAEFVDFSERESWQTRFFVNAYAQNVTETATVATAPDGRALRGNSATASNAAVFLDGDPDLADEGLVGELLILANDARRVDRTYVILAVDAAAKAVLVDGLPELGGAPSPWRVGQNARVYEVFLQAPNDLAPTLAEPIVYGNVGVSAADDKQHTLDDPVWADAARGNLGGPERYGNEGRVSAPARVFRVRREPPPTPDIPVYDSDRVWATPADYHSESFYTFRWVSLDHVKTHVFRALDDAVFKADRKLRPRRAPRLTATNLESFPVEWRVGDAENDARRAAIAAALNELDDINEADAMAHYRELSNDALRVLAALPGTERAFTQLTIQPLDPGDGKWDNRRGPSDPDDFAVPDATNPLAAANLRIYIDTLDGRTSSRYFYRAAYVDGAQNRSARLSLSSPPVYLPDVLPPAKVRLLAALGGDRRVTLKWGAHRERAMQRYRVYRSVNKSDGRDVRLMDLVADLPAAPIVVAGGEIDLGPSTDVTVVERVYASNAFDPRADLLFGQQTTQYLAAPTAALNGRVAGVAAPDGTPVVAVYWDSRDGLQVTPWDSAARIWTDQGLAGSRTYYYRVVAAREAETNRGRHTLYSQPSDLGAARAVDLVPPDPPEITTIEWVRVADDGAIFPYEDPVPAGESRRRVVRLVWASPDPELDCLVQSRWDLNRPFTNASGWLGRGVYDLIHENDLDFLDQEYRIKVVSRAGNANTNFASAVLLAVRT